MLIKSARNRDLPCNMQRNFRLVDQDQAIFRHAEKQFVKDNEFVLLSGGEVLELDGADWVD